MVFRLAVKIQLPLRRANYTGGERQRVREFLLCKRQSVQLPVADSRGAFGAMSGNLEGLRSDLNLLVNCVDLERDVPHRRLALPHHDRLGPRLETLRTHFHGISSCSQLREFIMAVFIGKRWLQGKFRARAA